MQDELTLLNDEIDAMELGKGYMLVDPDTQLDFQTIGSTKSKLKDKQDVNPDAKLDKIDLALLQVGNTEKEWSYRRVRNSVASLHVALFEYVGRLSAYISYSKTFRGKFTKCRKRLNLLESELKDIMQDKVKLQELVKDLSAKYKLLEHAIKKVGDINQDNKETIENIRINRDKCVQTVDNRNEVITSLRNQNSELRRHLASLRSKFGK